jgi:hypothetical protein
MSRFGVRADMTLEQATRRMLRCLDAYWNWYEVDGDHMQTWWNAFEEYRALVESKVGRNGPR